MTGLEPATSAVTGRRSTLLSYMAKGTVRCQRRGWESNPQNGIVPFDRLAIG